MVSAVHHYALPDPDVVLAYQYDGAGRIVRMVQDAFTTQYSYQIDHTLNRRDITYPSGRIVREDYDLRDRLARVTDQPSGNLIADRSYDPGNRLTHQLYGNATMTDWQYNANDWTTRITHSNAGGPFTDL